MRRGIRLVSLLVAVTALLLTAGCKPWDYGSSGFGSSGGGPPTTGPSTTSPSNPGGSTGSSTPPSTSETTIPTPAPGSVPTDKPTFPTQIVPRPETTTLSPAQTAEVTYGPNGSSVVQIAAGGPAPRVGGFVVSEVSSSAPQGVLGRVQSVSPSPGGGYTVTLTKATLDDAYSVFKLNTTVSGGTTTYADGSEPGTNPAPQLRRPAAATTGGGPNTTLAKGAFSCDKPSASDDVKVAFDFSNVSFDVAIDAGQPYARVVATVSPKLTVTYTAEAAQHCKLNADAFSYRIPIAVAGVPLQIVVHPTVELDASAKLVASVTLTPTLTTGIAVLGGTASPIGSLTATASATIDGTVTVDAFLGITGVIALPGGGEGTAGLSLTGGPRGQVELNDQRCITVSAGVKAYGEVFVSTLVNKWQATLATFEPALQQVYSSCTAGPPPNVTYGSHCRPGTPVEFTVPPLQNGVPYDEFWNISYMANCEEPISGEAAPLGSVSVRDVGITQTPGELVKGPDGILQPTGYFAKGTPAFSATAGTDAGYTYKYTWTCGTKPDCQPATQVFTVHVPLQR